MVAGAQTLFSIVNFAGKSDALQQQYWLYVSMQHQRDLGSSVRLPVDLAEQRIDGVTFQPSIGKTPSQPAQSFFDAVGCNPAVSQSNACWYEPEHPNGVS